MQPTETITRVDRSWHNLDTDAVFEALNASPFGLSTTEAISRREQYGPNSLPERQRISAFTIFLRQFRSSLLIILAVAAIFSFFNSDSIEGIAILAILLLNGVIGFYHEYKAESAVLSLHALTRPTCKTRRDHSVTAIDPRDLVPGDVILLEAGDRVPADCRLFITHDISANEAPLTGESLPVPKSKDVLPSVVILAERSNMAYMGTTIARGAAEGVVVGIGSQTELGKIAQLLATEPVQERSPLQRTVDDLSKKLGWASIALVIGVFLLGMLRQSPSVELFMLAVSVAIAAVPEGLPAIVTIALSLGTSAMAKRNAIVRKLEAIETLGTTTVICTDKTGTLTTGEMTVRAVWTHAPDQLQLVLAGCETAQEGIMSVGDPTELALLRYATKHGVHRSVINETYPELMLLPFDSERKMMSVVRTSPEGSLILLAKGAPDVILTRCASSWGEGGLVPLDDRTRSDIREQIENYASRGMRLIAAATRVITDFHQPMDDLERELTFVGLVALADPPREESHDMVRVCQEAGIEVKMITGDHPATAFAIARELRIARREADVVRGSELDEMSEADLASRVSTATVFARVSPAHKLQIVNALRSRNAIVAMTGDGVNDAPAIAGAHIGLAMGRTGTDVAKDASDIIIVDDNFATIARAVEFGRSAFRNIRKSVDYLLTGNITELGLMGLCFAAGLPPPLTALQLLWINLVTDGLPALVLAAEGVQPGVMKEPPRTATESLASMKLARKMLLLGGANAVYLFACYHIMILISGAPAGQSSIFMLLVLSEMFRSLSYRDPEKSIHTYSLTSTIPMLLVTSFTIGLQLVITLTAWGRQIFNTTQFSIEQLFLLFLLSLVPAGLAELQKRLRKMK